MTRVATALIILGGLCALPAAQAQQTSIAGRIVTDETPGRPAARASVTLAGASLRQSLVAIADADGRFAFASVPAGQFTLTAAKPTYLTMAYGQTQPGRGGGLPISVADGQQIAGLTWKLPRGGVITGRVLDERGVPMRDVPIVLMQYRTENDQRALREVSCCVWPTTDVDGNYRVFGILPGEYIVAAIPPGDYRFIPSGPWAASGREARQVDSAEMQWALQQVAGGPRTSTQPDPPPGRVVSYGRVFYPGTIDEATATTVTIAAGEEKRGIDLPMRLQPAARIELRVVGPDGQPAVKPSVSMGGATTSDGRAARSFRNLLPGTYTISARTVSPPLWGTIDIPVNGEDVLDAVLQLQPGPTISGRVVFESASRPSGDPATVRISFRPGTPMLLPVAVGADGSFQVRGIDPGRYRVTATLGAAGRAVGAATGGWVVKSAMLGGRDVADVPFDLRPGETLTDLVVTFTDRLTELSGTLFDANGRPAPGFYVAVFPTDTTLWSAGSRRQPAPVRAATDGRFAFSGLPPGSYHIVALTSVDQVDLADATFLKALAASAITVTLGDGERKVQDLKFGR